MPKQLNMICFVLIWTCISFLQILFSGFSHEMNRQDRDEFLVVDFDNIKENKKHNYKKRINTKTEHFDAEYDDNDVDDALTPFDITSVLMY